MIRNGEGGEARPKNRPLLGVLASPVDDQRLPAPDVLGHLADRLIRRCDLDLVAEHVREAWPAVMSVRCAIYRGLPHFLIHIHPFSKQAQRDHWPLADWIETALHTRDCHFLFLPPIKNGHFAAGVTIYQASKCDTDTGSQHVA